MKRPFGPEDLVIGVCCHGCHKELLGRAIPHTNFQVRQVAQHLEGAGGKGDDGRTGTGRELTTAYLQNGPAIIHLGSKACFQCLSTELLIPVAFQLLYHNLLSHTVIIR